MWASSGECPHRDDHPHCRRAAWSLVQAMPGKLPAASSGQLLVASFGGIDPRSGASYVTSELGAGGPGRYRGGLGATKVFEATSGDVVVSIRGERYFTQPWGLAGGRPAASAQAWVERADGSIEEIPSKRVLTLSQGESLHVGTPGGGGYGDPLERDPEAVQQDVYDRRSTVMMARE